MICFLEFKNIRSYKLFVLKQTLKVPVQNLSIDFCKHYRNGD
jgi:hypothetical protein